MSYTPKHNAAFINAIADEGTKEEAIEWLQKTWDDYVDLKKEVESMEKSINWLTALESAGVDNWDGISFAYELYEQSD